jgi:histidinol-phosphate aminotransferase
MTNAETHLPSPAEPLKSLTRMREGGSERRGYVPLDRNERVAPLPDWFMDELRKRLDSSMLVDYPATDELHDRLAQSLGVPPERLLLTPGADPVFRALFQIYAGPGDQAVMLDPSYAMYAVYAQMFGAEAIGIPYREDLTPDMELMLDSIKPGVKLVLIANPNQPTGTMLDLDALRAIVDRAEQAGALVVIDEAYYLFEDIDALPLIDESPNVLVIRTFSKAGFAGARLAFAAGSEEVIGNLFKVRSAADFNSFAVLCGHMLLDHPEVAEDYGKAVRAGAELLSERARALGLEPLPTSGNFLLIRLKQGQDPKTVVSALADRKWLIKGPFGAPALAGCIRVTLGPPELMGEFADVLAEVLA